MSRHFLDSSAVAKFYHAETGSAIVEQMVVDPGAGIVISRLLVVEVQSVFAGKVRSSVISPSDAADLRRRFLEDIANERFGIAALTSNHYEKAGELIERHGASQGLRTLDSLQLAVALGLYRGGAIETVIAAGRVLCRVATAEGIPVIDPESIP